MRRSKPFVAAVVVLAALGLGTPASTADPAENSVTHWTRIAEQFITIGRPPASSEVIMGTVQAAIYDAVAATEGGLEPFMASVQAPTGASTDAAVATAARDVLVARVPLQAVPITTEYDTFMGTIADGQAKTDGQQVGTAVAEEILLLRAERWPGERRSLRAADAGARRVRARRADDAGRRRAHAGTAVHVRLALELPSERPD